MHLRDNIPLPFTTEVLSGSVHSATSRRSQRMISDDSATGNQEALLSNSKSSNTKVSGVDSTIGSDKLKLFKMDDNIMPIKFRLIRRWHFVLPMSISLVAIAISAASLVGALVHINHLTQELEKRTGGSGSSLTAQTGSRVPSQTGQLLERNAPIRDVVTSLHHDVELLKSILYANDPTLIPKGKNSSLLRLEHGSTYVRWGRKECSGDAQLLYTGFAAGSPTARKKMSGGGVQYLCLPTDPEWNRFDISNDSLAFGWIYGAEYMSDKTKIFEDEIHGQNVPCSLCHSPRSAKVMIPAKRTCPSSWTKEYEGYLMSSYITNQRATFECVDEVPEGVNGTEGVTGGAQFYHIAGYCVGQGSLMHCPPYVHARELTCVVCTK